MTVRKTSKAAFGRFVENLIKEQKVFGPCAKGDRFEFELLDSADQLRLDYDVTLQPPGRKYLLPPVETLLTYQVGGKYQSVFGQDKFVLLGVHPYDMAAINQTDELFRQDQYDKHYMDRRKQMTIVALDVVTPSVNVFAASMGTATVDKGYDMLLTVLEDGSILADTATEKGQALLKETGSMPYISCTD